MKFYFLAISLLSTTVFANPLPYYENKGMTPYWLKDVKLNDKVYTPAQVTSFEAINQDGRLINKSSMENQITLVNFFFVQCPGVCPMMMKSVQRLQKTLDKDSQDIQIFSFSVLPESDTPKKLKEYTKKYKINEKNWTLLTGKKDVIYHVGKDMFKADGAVGKQKSEDSFIHTQNLYLVDQQLRIRGIYNSSDLGQMVNLQKDIQSLKNVN